MFKTIFSKLFGTATKASAAISTPKTAELNTTAQPDITDYYRAEIANSPFIKESGREAVLRDFLHEVKLKDGELLSLEEKRSLGINSRLKITRELYEVLTPEGVEFGPKKVMESLYLTATIHHSHRAALARMRVAGITQYSLMSCGDGQDCDWCASMEGKLIPIEVDFVRLSKENCTCYRCGCVLRAKIDF